MRHFATSSQVAASPAGMKLLKPVSMAAIAGASLLLWAAILTPFLA